jgi:hypothetical protein
MMMRLFFAGRRLLSIGELFHVPYGGVSWYLRSFALRSTVLVDWCVCLLYIYTIQSSFLNKRSRAARLSQEVFPLAQNFNRTFIYPFSNYHTWGESKHTQSDREEEEPKRRCLSFGMHCKAQVPRCRDSASSSSLHVFFPNDVPPKETVVACLYSVTFNPKHLSELPSLQRIQAKEMCRVDIGTSIRCTEHL